MVPTGTAPFLVAKPAVRVWDQACARKVSTRQRKEALGTFLTSLLLFGGLALILGSPVLILARRLGRDRTWRQFLIAGIAVGVVCATLAFSSASLVDQCLAAGNPTCADYGATGLQLLFVGGYVAFAWLTAYMMARD